MEFDGQQSGEQILYTILPHRIPTLVSHLMVVSASLLLLFVFQFAFSGLSIATPIIQLIGFGGTILILVIGLWWNLTRERLNRTYITDRRIIRFDAVSPVFKTKRALFWTEALKAKAVTTNIVYRSLQVGDVVVEPQAAEQESIYIPNVSMYEDVANYIDKILYIIKNKPNDLATIKSFIPKPKGKRE